LRDVLLRKPCQANSRNGNRNFTASTPLHVLRPLSNGLGGLRVDKPAVGDICSQLSRRFGIPRHPDWDMRLLDRLRFEDRVLYFVILAFVGDTGLSPHPLCDDERLAQAGDTIVMLIPWQSISLRLVLEPRRAKRVIE